MKLYIVITTEKCLNTDFAPTQDAVPFKTLTEAKAYRANYLYSPFEIGFQRTAEIVEKEI